MYVVGFTRAGQCKDLYTKLFEIQVAYYKHFFHLSRNNTFSSKKFLIIYGSILAIPLVDLPLLSVIRFGGKN